MNVYADFDCMFVTSMRRHPIPSRISVSEHRHWVIFFECDEVREVLRLDGEERCGDVGFGEGVETEGGDGVGNVVVDDFSDLWDILRCCGASVNDHDLREFVVELRKRVDMKEPISPMPDVTLDVTILSEGII